ncbi:NAD+ synthetase [Hoeflea phototrophica DFL-43]|uniref:Glutamine-dependent NAD(+) synthetase n=1 Tax=Hoeflea phototrophica (strain DSM 17068 / NCIMB 14078 / DFL-43) TaxID=411684 RepID=A9D6J3_HOEPD|nr:NAD+ synthetase [Hoeflea phototrophica DFL-43]
MTITAPTSATDTLRIAVAQLNPTVGDVAGNLAKAREARADAHRHGADIVLFTELFIVGYPPEDLVLKPALIRSCLKAVNELAADTADGGPAVIIGYPRSDDGKRHNSVAVLDGGKLVTSRDKVDLPNYGEFDEKRVFDVGEMPGPVAIRGVRLGIPICEDIWGDLGVCETLAESGAEILLVPNGSPYYRGKVDVRHQVVLRQVIESGLPMVFANQVGGQDELVFDGASFAMNADKSLGFQMSQFEETVSIVTFKRQDDGTWRCKPGPMSVVPEGEEADYRACMLGLRDYVNKNGFRNVVLGLSGGIDSALCAALAVDALGEERVRTVMLPYRYTSESSFTDAEACARALGCHYDTVAIEEPVQGFLSALGEMFEGTDEGITEENLQSRARGVILMAISNKFGSMVVTTGNKSEMSVGYATLYGDMNGGFNPIKDLYKLQVYALSRWRNAHVPPGALGPSGEVIPVNIINKAPSAELRPDQTDQDSLPPYEVLDDILECLVEHEMGVEEIVARGHDIATVHRIEHLLYIAEYKRRQSAPGVKITRKNFGRDRRYPITNRYRDR